MATAARRRRLNLDQPASTPRGSIYEGFVGTRAGCAFGTNGSAKIDSRSSHVATADIHRLKIAHAAVYFSDTDGVENSPANTDTIIASIEYPSGQFSQIMWPAGDRLVATPGGYYESLYTRPCQMIPIGATYWIRKLHSSSGSSCCGYDKNPNTAMGDLCNLNGTTDHTMGGTITGTSFWSPPTAIIGQTNAPSVIADGDSICYGPLDETVGLIKDFRRGIICHAFPADTLAFLNHGNSTIKASNFQAGSTVRRQMWKYASHAIDALGRNDLDAGDSAATLESNLKKLIYSQFPARTRIYRTTITPKSSSAGGQWVSDVDQSANANNSVRVTFNADVRNLAIQGVLDFFETADPVENVRDGGKYLNDGVTNKLNTNDGLHPNNRGYGLSGTANASAVTTKIFYP